MSPRLCRGDGHSGAAQQGFGAAELATKTVAGNKYMDKYMAESLVYLSSFCIYNFSLYPNVFLYYTVHSLTHIICDNIAHVCTHS